MNWTVSDVKDVFDYVKDSVDVNVIHLTENRPLKISSIGLGELGKRSIDIFIEDAS